MSKFIHVPLSRKEVSKFIKEHHRHHGMTTGYKAAIGASLNGVIVGVGIIGRPVARCYDDGWTCEINRVAVMDAAQAKDACSFLYGALRRLGFAMGYRRVITYTLPSESGTSLRAAGYRLVGVRKGGSWSCPSRPRIDTHPIGQKMLWEC